MKAVITIIISLIFATQLSAQQDQLMALENPRASLPTPTENEATSPQKLKAKEANSWLGNFRTFCGPYFIKSNSLMAVLGDEGIVLESEAPDILKVIIPAEDQEIPDNFIWKNDTWLLKSGKDPESGATRAKGELGGMPVYTSCQLVTWDGMPFILFEFEHVNQ